MKKKYNSNKVKAVAHPPPRRPTYPSDVHTYIPCRRDAAILLKHPKRVPFSKAGSEIIPKL